MIAAFLDGALSLHPLITAGLGAALVSIPVLAWKEPRR